MYDLSENIRYKRNGIFWEHENPTISGAIQRTRIIFGFWCGFKYSMD